MFMNSQLTDIGPIASGPSRSSQAGSWIPERDGSQFSSSSHRTGPLAGPPLIYRGLGLGSHVVKICPPEAVTRRAMVSDGMTAEIIHATSRDRLEFRFCAPVHLLVVYEQGARRDGETFVQNLPKSSLREVSGKLIFVPAGHEYRDWHDPRTMARLIYFCFDPAKLRIVCDSALAEISFGPRLFFENKALLETALKLKRSMESSESENRPYLEALGLVLAHELVRLNCGSRSNEPVYRGGLAAWQQRVVLAHIEAHLDEPISLATLAQLARLSRYHFCRAFKQSFGVPPHRYHTNCRMERAKALLEKRAHSVQEIGATVGYGETSSFTVAFRKATGMSPTSYQRSLA